MKERSKIILLIITAITLLLYGFVYVLAHTIEIEDHYGDLQNFYYQSKEGDIILNHDTNRFGFIKKDFKRIYVINDNYKEVDLYHWIYIYDDFKESKNEVYRSEGTINFSKLRHEDILKLIHENKFELVIKN